MKNIRIFYVKNCHFLVVKFSMYLNRHVFVMDTEIWDPLKLCKNEPCYSYVIMVKNTQYDIKAYYFI